MKPRNVTTSRLTIRLVLLLPSADYAIYLAARRILRRLMAAQAPTLEALLLQSLHGRDANGVADHYLDSIDWPLELGRAVTVRMANRIRRGNAVRQKQPRQVIKLAKPPAD